MFPESVIREVDDEHMLQRMVIDREVERVIQRDTKWEVPPRLVCDRCVGLYYHGRANVILWR